MSKHLEQCIAITGTLASVAIATVAVAVETPDRPMGWMFGVGIVLAGLGLAWIISTIVTDQP